jgi:anti-sigma factor RsiW
MKHCDTIKESLGAWLDGELSGGDAESVRSHLAACSVCAEERRQLEKLQFSLKKVLESQAAGVAIDSIWRGVQRKIAEKRPPHEVLWEWARETFTAPRLAWAVPAVILLLLGAFSVGSWRSGGQRNNFATVESIDAYGRNVALLREDDTKTTVIWLYPNQEGEDESAAETTETHPSF